MKKINPVKRGDHDYLRKRVPSRYAAIDPRSVIQISLFTDSLEIARRKAAEVWAELIEAWEAKLDGSDAEGEARGWRSPATLPIAAAIATSQHQRWRGSPFRK